MRSSEIIDNGQKLDLDHHGYSGVLIHVCLENIAGHGAVDDPGRGQAVTAQPGNER